MSNNIDANHPKYFLEIERTLICITRGVNRELREKIFNELCEKIEESSNSSEVEGENKKTKSHKRGGIYISG